MKRMIEAQLVTWKGRTDRKPLLLKGTRQVGKTHSLKEFAQKHFAAVHYVNFELEQEVSSIFAKDLRPARILEHLSLHLNRPIRPERDLVIFDEIQQCPKAITSLKYFQEELPTLALCAAGSLIGVHLGEASFPVGKVDLMHLYPMCFEEFLEGIGEERLADFIRGATPATDIPEIIHSDLWRKLLTYFVVGGLPEVVGIYDQHKENLFLALEAVRKRQSELLNTYLADIAKHSGKTNAMHIERVLHHVPAKLAREMSGGAGRFRFRGVIPGINRYARMAGAIDWLESAGLIIKVPIADHAEQPISAHIKESIFKLYLFDVGLLGALGGLSPKTILDYDYGTYKGYFAENFVAQEFLCGGVAKLYGWRSGRPEIEFVREIGGDIMPVEVKSGRVIHSQSLKIFMDKYRAKYGVIISGRPLQIKDRIHKYPLYLAGRVPLV